MKITQKRNDLRLEVATDYSYVFILSLSEFSIPRKTTIP